MRPADRIEDFSGTLALIRKGTPLVHNITNGVAMNFSANALIAIGASPLMSHEKMEMKDISGISDSLLINIGTLDKKQIEAMDVAARLASERGKPWVLDPVGAGASVLRRAVSLELVEKYRPSILKGNASEIISLAGSDAAGRGVDSTENMSVASDAARELSARFGVTVAVTGPSDLVVSGDACLELHGGSPLMTGVTAMGCALGSIMAAFAAVEQDFFKAACQAISLVCTAGEQAASVCNGPGSMQICFIDALSSIR